MNELKPRIQLQAPDSLKRNVMERIGRETPRKRRVAIWQWSAAAAVVTIGVMTFAFWHGSSVKQEIAMNDIPAISKPSEVAKPGAEVVPTIVPMSVSPVKKTTTHRAREVSHRLKKSSDTHKTLNGEREKAKGENEDEIIVAGFGNPKPITGAIHREEGNDVSQSLESQEYTPEEQRLIDRLDQYRDLVNARLAEELEQAACVQARWQEMAYDKWLRLRQILLPAYPMTDGEKSENTLPAI